MAIWIIKHLLNLTSFSLQTKQCHCNEHIKQTQIGRLTKRAKLLLSHRLTLKKIACERSSKFVHKTRKYNNKSIWVGRDRAKITIIQRQTHTECSEQQEEQNGSAHTNIVSILSIREDWRKVHIDNTRIYGNVAYYCVTSSYLIVPV